MSINYRQVYSKINDLKREWNLSKDIVSVSDDQTVATVAGIMGEERVGSVIVNGKGKPSEIFNAQDLVEAYAR